MRLEIIYTTSIYLASLIADVKCKGVKDKTHDFLRVTSDEDDLSNEKHYWETSSSLETRENSENDLSLHGKLRRQFALSLFLQKPMESAVCSPLSALMPLGKLALGASGTTRKELLAAIGVNKLSQAKTHFKKIISELRNITGVIISIYSGLYLSRKDKLNCNFKKEAKNVFGLGVEIVDFSNPTDAVAKINAQVSKHSKNKIKDLLNSDDVTTSTSLVLVNAIYFSGNWLFPFPKAKQGVFKGSKGKQNVHMLKVQDRYQYYDSASLDAQVLEINYKEGSQASLVIVLPSSSSSLTLLLKAIKVAPELLKNAIKEMTYRTVSLTIPKFKIESKFDLNTQYENIGLKSMFRKGLTNIVDGKEIVVSKAVQAAMIEIDENGTEAAAATAMTFVKSAAPSDEVKFTADHPFLFVLKVRDQQLFSGVVNDFPN